MIKKMYDETTAQLLVTFEVPTDQLPADLSVTSLCVAGEFNNWSASANPLAQAEDGNAWRTTLRLEGDRSYQFRYVINGDHWCNDWAADGYVANDYSCDNCVVNTTLPVMDETVAA